MVLPTLLAQALLCGEYRWLSSLWYVVGDEVPEVEFFINFLEPALGLGGRTVLVHILVIKFPVEFAVEDLDLWFGQCAEVLGEGLVGGDPGAHQMLNSYAGRKDLSTGGSLQRRCGRGQLFYWFLSAIQHERDREKSVMSQTRRLSGR
jgi:hypothetical protein